MERGKLAQQSPYIEDAALYPAINALYLYLSGVNSDLTVLETGPSGTFTTVDGKTITVSNGRVTSIV